MPGDIKNREAGKRRINHGLKDISMREGWKRVVQMNQPLKDNDKLRGRLSQMKSILQRELDKIDECLEIKYTGWFVLVKKDSEGRWRTVGTISPDQSCEEECDWFENLEFDLIMPIPDPSTVSEFHGF